MSKLVRNIAITNRCKCCLRERSSKDLWSEHFYHGESEIYGLMLFECFRLSWNEPESGTERICNLCIGRLKEAHLFKKQILDAQKILSRISKDDEFDIEQKVEEFLQKHLNISTKAVEKPENFTETTNSYNGILDGVDSQDSMDDQDYFTEVEYLEMDTDDKFGNEEKAQKTVLLIGNTFITKVENDTPLSPKNSTAVPITTMKTQDVSTTPLKIDTMYTTKKVHTPNQTTTKEKKKPQEPNRNVHEERDRHQDNLAALLLSTNATPVHSHQDKGYECGFCGSFYMIPADLKEHIIQEHTEQEKEKYMFETELNRLVYKIDITDLRCNHCDESLDDLDSVWSHLASHNISIHMDIKNQIIPYKFESDAYQCFQCGAQFARFRTLTSHMNVHYPNYMCSECGNGFINSRTMKMHTRLHENGTFQCSMCPKVFNVRIRWQMHEKYHKEGPVARNNRCGVCGERFSDILQKYRHLELKHGMQRVMYECGQCSKHLTSKKTLRNHIQNVHFKIKQYQCPVCGKECYDKISVTRHMANKHSNEKGKLALKCKYCPKVFRREVSYNLHIQAHLGDKQHLCEWCSETFMGRAGLLSHLRSKHAVLHDVLNESDEDVIIDGTSPSS